MRLASRGKERFFSTLIVLSPSPPTPSISANKILPLWKKCSAKLQQRVLHDMQLKKIRLSNSKGTACVSGKEAVRVGFFLSLKAQRWLKWQRPDGGVYMPGRGTQTDKTAKGLPWWSVDSGFNKKTKKKNLYTSRNLLPNSVVFSFVEIFKNNPKFALKTRLLGLVVSTDKDKIVCHPK